MSDPEKPKENPTEASEAAEVAEGLPQGLQDFLIELRRNSDTKVAGEQISTYLQENYSTALTSGEQADLEAYPPEVYTIAFDKILETPVIVEFLENTDWDDPDLLPDLFQRFLATLKDVLTVASIEFKASERQREAEEDQKSDIERTVTEFKAGPLDSYAAQLLVNFEEIPENIKSKAETLIEDIENLDTTGLDQAAVNEAIQGFTERAEEIFADFKEHLLETPDLTDEQKEAIQNASDCAELKLALETQESAEPAAAATPTEPEMDFGETFAAGIEAGCSSLSEWIDFFVKNWKGGAALFGMLWLGSKVAPGTTDSVIKNIPSSEKREVFLNLESGHWALNMKKPENEEWQEHMGYQQKAASWFADELKVNGESVSTDAGAAIVRSLFNSELTVGDFLALADGKAGSDPKKIEELEVPAAYAEHLDVFQAVYDEVSGSLGDNYDGGEDGTNLAKYVADNLYEAPSV